MVSKDLSLNVRVECISSLPDLLISTSYCSQSKLQISFVFPIYDTIIQGYAQGVKIL